MEANPASAPIAIIKCLIPQRLRRRMNRIAAPYGGWSMLLRCILHPKSFNEKVQRCKILNRDPRLPQREDKILVKDFVKDRLGSEWVIPTLWHGEFLPPLELRTWPIPFVIKANNGCGYNYFVRRDSDLNWAHIKHLAEEWRRAPFGAEIGEWLYGQIKPRLLVEPFIGDGGALPVDYKFWTFGGKVRFIQVDTDREHDHKRVMFDTAWRRLPFTVLYPSDPRAIPKPKSLDRMIEAAEALAEDFAFVRVDLYDAGDHPKFGEMSFYPESGFGPFTPSEWDIKAGRLWQLGKHYRIPRVISSISRAGLPPSRASVPVRRQDDCGKQRPGREQHETPNLLSNGIRGRQRIRSRQA